MSDVYGAQSLGDIFSGLTPEQIEALKTRAISIRPAALRRSSEAP